MFFAILGIIISLAIVMVLFPKQIDFLIDFFYDIRQEYRSMKGKKRLWRIVVKKVELIMPKSIVTPLNRMIRLSGNPFNLTAVELISIELIITVSVLGSLPLFQKSQVELLILLFIAWIFPFTRFQRKMKERQFHAKMSIRFIKKRLYTQLKMKIPLSDALQEIAEQMPENSFIKEFRSVVSQLSRSSEGRSISELMQQLRKQFEVKELDDFCLAIEVSDEKSVSVLSEQLQRQIEEESQRLDELMRQRTEMVKPKLLGLATFIFLLSMFVFAYFGIMIVKDQFSNGSIFFFF